MWVVKLEHHCGGNVVSRRDVMTITRPERLEGLEGLEDLGLTLEDGRMLLADLQQLIVTEQFERGQEADVLCPDCGRRRWVKDYADRRFDTLFGRVTVRQARLQCPQCVGRAESVGRALLGRSTPEFDRLRAWLCAQMSYRVARKVMNELLPVSGGTAHTTLRNHVLQVADVITEQRSREAAEGSAHAAPSLTIGLDSAFVHSTRPAGDAVVGRRPSHRVLVGTVLDGCGERSYVASVAHAEHSHASLLRAEMDRHGFAETTRLTFLTDGELGLRQCARRTTGRKVTPHLDWFHLSMKVKHIENRAQSLSTQYPSHRAATGTIQGELERLRWRLWHGRVNAVEVTRERLRDSIEAYQQPEAASKQYRAARDVWSMLRELSGYVRSKFTVLFNYATRHRAGLPISTATTESAVNHAVNRRMNKRQQMRWSAHGAHQLLQVRTAVINGNFHRLARTPRDRCNAVAADYLPMAA